MRFGVERHEYAAYSEPAFGGNGEASMAIAGPEDRDVYHQINVDVSSLQAWSDELHRLVGLTQVADKTVGHLPVDGFAGAGPDGASALRDLNAEALATLAAAVEQLDDRIARLRDAAAYVASSYADSDAYAQANTDEVEAGWSGQVPAASASGVPAGSATDESMGVVNDG
jgi:hypothetical protein